MTTSLIIMIMDCNNEPEEAFLAGRDIKRRFILPIDYTHIA